MREAPPVRSGQVVGRSARTRERAVLHHELRGGMHASISRTYVEFSRLRQKALSGNRARRYHVNVFAHSAAVLQGESLPDFFDAPVF